MKGPSLVKPEPPAGYALRDAREADLPALGLLQAAARVAADIEPEPALPLAALDLCRAAGSLWLAVDAVDLPVGYLAASESDGAMLLLAFGVARAHQRLGLGGALLDRALDHARWRFLPAAAVILDAGAPVAGPFFSRRGFVRLDATRAEPGLQQKLAMRASQAPRPSDPCIMARLL
ncbi:MAG: GNAT family N-acetyltransferase [Salinarimonas sp.]|nr:GNAT family N-acetyltransferase [Salinarimonas sp.]